MQSRADQPLNAPAPGGFHYRAFISYSHTDGAWAKWIHHALETYPIPARLVGHNTPHGPVPARLKPVFRDRDELPTAAELGPVLERALRDSGALVVLCSPSSAKSRWVNEEVLFFKKLGCGDRVFPLIVRGTPGGKDGQECFPPGVRAVVSADGTVTPDALEPLAADAQPDKDGKRLALLKVIAGITGLPLDELRQREAQRRQKRLAILASIGLVLTLVMSVLAAIAFDQRQAALRNEELALTNLKRAQTSEQIAKTAQAAAVQDRETARQALAKSALALAEAALREGNSPEMLAALAEVPGDLRDSTWRYLFGQSDTSIIRARNSSLATIESVAVNPRRPRVFALARRTRVVRVIELGAAAQTPEFTPGFKEVDRTLRLAFSPDGERLAVGQWGTGGIVIHNARDGKKLAEWNAPQSDRLEFSADGKLLFQTERGLTTTKGALKMWDAETKQLLWEYESTGGPAKGAFTPDGQQVVAYGFGEKLRLVHARDGKLVRPLVNRTLTALAVRPDGRMAVVAVLNGGIRGVRLSDGGVLFEFRPPHDRPVQHLLFTPDGARFVSIAGLADGRQALHLWDADTGVPLQTLLGGSGPATDAAVHPLSGELFICGPDTRVWSLTSTPAKWALRASVSTLAFWGSDDTVFMPADNFRGALVDLKNTNPTVLWKPPKNTYYSI